LSSGENSGEKIVSLLILPPVFQKNLQSERHSGIFKTIGDLASPELVIRLLENTYYGINGLGKYRKKMETIASLQSFLLSCFSFFTVSAPV
jgi:hypothetical protein